MTNSILKVRRTHLLFGVAAIVLIFWICVYLVLLGEFVAVAAWLFVIAIFVPIFLASRLVKSTLLHMVVGIALVTQVISVPIFVVSRDYYTPTGWTAVKDFSFTFFEFVPIYLLLAFFLIVVVYCVAFLLSVFKLPKLPLSQDENISIQQQTIRRKTGYFLFLLIATVVLNTPLNLWMFRNGVAMTGIEPPALPYRLSGILHYLTSFVVPVVLAVLYAKTSRTYAPAIILMAYAFILGAGHVSKGALLMVMLPIFYCAILDRKYVLLSISALFTLAALQIVVLLRNVVYVVTDGKSGSDTASGLIEILNKLVKFGLEDYSIANVFAMMGGVVDRIESAQSIVLASKFNVDAAGGVVTAFLGFYNNSWSLDDPDKFNIELMGISLPEGFANSGGDLLAKSLLLTQSQPLYIAIFAINVAVFIFLGEWIARSISAKYSVPAFYYIAGGLYVLFFYTAAGSTTFLGLLMLLVITAITPKLRTLRMKLY